jgi:uncharacterized membrane protein YiaA
MSEWILIVGGAVIFVIGLWIARIPFMEELAIFPLFAATICLIVGVMGVVGG